MSAASSFSIVVAADEANGIGREGKLPWRLSRELAFFRKLTSDAAPNRQNAVIMGRKTFESIAPKFRPLSQRINVVLSRDEAYRAEGALGARSLDQALSLLAARSDVDHRFVIGGGELYRTALVHPLCTRAHLTRVHARFDCDTHLPALDAQWRRTALDGPHVEGDLRYTFETYDRT